MCFVVLKYGRYRVGRCGGVAAVLLYEEQVAASDAGVLILPVFPLELFPCRSVNGLVNL